jgi:hypothetical protein
LKNLLTRIGGARNCLLVYVAEGSLTIVPVFPFNLMFLPEIYGIEATAPISDVAIEGVKDGLFGKSIILTIRGSKPRRFELWLEDRDGFQSALEGKGSVRGMAGVDEPLRRPRAGRLAIIVQIFAIVWGLGALAAGAMGLQDDLRFVSQGVTVTGRIAGHTGQTGARNDQGIASYLVAGRTYALVSSRGSGVYRLGERDQLRYIPTDPTQAREEDELGFDLLWLVLGAIAMILGVAFGWIRGAFARALNVRREFRTNR